jgi:hypothetical protein
MYVWYSLCKVFQRCWHSCTRLESKMYKLRRCPCTSYFPFELGYMSKESKTPSHHHQRQLCKFKAARVNLIYSGDCLISTGVIVYNIAVILCMDEKPLRWVQRHSEWSSQTMHSILTNDMSSVHQIGWLVLETLIVDGNAKCQLSS